MRSDSCCSSLFHVFWSGFADFAADGSGAQRASSIAAVIVDAIGSGSGAISAATSALSAAYNISVRTGMLASNDGA
jgi:hypothetical protein